MKSNVIKKLALLLVLIQLTACTSTPSKKVDHADLNTGKLIFITDSKGYDQTMKKTLEVMKEKYSNVEVEFNVLANIFEESREVYDTRLKTKLLAGDNDFDIFLINNNHLDYIKNDVVEDLGKYSDIVKNYDNIFDGIKLNMTFDGRLIGVPYYYTLFILKENEALGKKLKLNLPEGAWSWEQFYNLSVKARQDINGDGNPDTYLMRGWRNYPYFMREYIISHTDFYKGKVSIDNKKLAENLVLWKRLWDEDLIKDLTGYDYDEQNDVLLSSQNLALFWGEKNIVRYPTVDGQKNYDTHTNFICINKFSKNKELASKFLSIYLSPEVQSLHPFNGALYKDIAVYQEAEKYFHEENKKVHMPGSDIMTNRFGNALSNEKNYKLYQELMKYSKVNFIPGDLHIYVGDTTKKFMNGEISAEKAAELIERKAKMIVEE